MGRPVDGFSWGQVDETLIYSRRDKFIRKMQELLIEDERRIANETRQKGNGAYFAPTFLGQQVERTDEWAQGLYEIYCDCWYRQGYLKSAAFLRALSHHVIATLMQVRLATIKHHFQTKYGHTVNGHGALAQFHREMNTLANDWQRRIEGEAREIEHAAGSFSEKLISEMTSEQAREALRSCESRLTEIATNLEAQKQALAQVIASGGSTTKIEQTIRMLSGQKAAMERHGQELNQRLHSSEKRRQTEVQDRGQLDTLSWRELEDRFRKLQPAQKGGCAHWNSKQFGDPPVNWYFSDWHDARAESNFKWTAEHAALKLAHHGGPNAVFFWLDLLREHSPNYRKRGVLATREDGLEEHIDTGTIYRVCEASADYCIKLDNDDLAANHAGSSSVPTVSLIGILGNDAQPRTAMIKAFLDTCNSGPASDPKVIKSHIWRVVGHKHPRQFQYWQAGTDRIPGNTRGATDEDDRNFRRILAMSRENFRALLRQKSILK